MDFRTIVPISKTTESITYYTSIVSLGSCFAVNMAQKFAYYKFPITVNPFGVLFHPLAIEHILKILVIQLKIFFFTMNCGIVSIFIRI